VTAPFAFDVLEQKRLLAILTEKKFHRAAPTLHNVRMAEGDIGLGVALLRFAHSLAMIRGQLCRDHPDRTGEQKGSGEAKDAAIAASGFERARLSNGLRI
jgi:hypothetical protein